MNKKTLVIVVLLVMIVGALGFFGAKYYKYTTEKNKTSALGDAFGTNIKTDVISFSSNFSVVRDMTLFYPIDEKNASSLANTISTKCLGFISEDAGETVGNLSSYVTNVANITSSALDSFSLDLSDDEAFMYICAIDCISVMDVYKTLSEITTITADEHAVFESFLSEYLSEYISACSISQNALDDSILELESTLDSLSKEQTEVSGNTKDFQNVIRCIDEFLSLRQYETTSDEEDSEPIKVLASLTDEEKAYLTEKITQADGYTDSDTVENASDTHELFSEVLTSLEENGTLDNSLIDELRILSPVVKSQTDESSEAEGFAFSDKILAIKQVSDRADESAILSLCNTDNIFSLVKSVKFGLEPSFWGTEYLSTICNNSIENISLPVLSSKEKFRTGITALENVVSSFDDNGSMSGEYEEKSSVYKEVLKVSYTESFSEPSDDMLTSLKENLEQIALYETTNDIELKKSAEEVTTHIDEILSLQTQIEEAEKQATKKKLSKTLSTECTSAGDTLKSMAPSLFEEYMSLLESLNNEYEKASRSSIKEDLSDALLKMNGVFADLVTLEETVKGYAGINYENLTKAMEDCDSTITQNSVDQAYIGISKIALETEVAYLEHISKTLSELKAEDNVLTLLGALEDTTRLLQNYLKEGKSLLTTEEYDSVCNALKELSDTISSVNKEQVVVNPESETLDDDLAHIRAYFGDLREDIDTTVKILKDGIITALNSEYELIGTASKTAAADKESYLSSISEEEGE